MRLDTLRQAFATNRAAWQTDIAGAVPEEVLVFETVGTISEFQAAVRRIDGLEWLTEWQDEEILPDEDFFDEAHPDKPLGGTLFLVMTNQQALDRIAGLWGDYKASGGAPLPRNFGPWGELFTHLRAVRFWNTEDRLRDTGLRENLDFELSQARHHVRIEAELWFYRDEGRRAGPRRAARLRQFHERIAADGGMVLTEAVIEEIAYHGVLLELPAAAVRRMLEGDDDLQILRDPAVMYFRPIGQTSEPVPTEEPLDGSMFAAHEIATGTPTVALLDGLPLENHRWLQGRLQIDDPDNWGADYEARHRAHGTAMASLILNGDANRPADPHTRPLYVRPIMRPHECHDGTFEERIPDDVLPLDLIHRAFRRIFDGDGGEGPVAPTVRIVNFSLGDKARQFDRAVSSWGRLFDWLAWHYNVLVLVSAGNVLDDIELDLPRAALEATSPEDLERLVIKAVATGAARRRLLVPGEAINVLTVAATHHDGAVVDDLRDRIDCYVTPGLPSPINRLGLGYRRAVKPDILLPGGRQLFRAKLGTSHDRAVLQLVRTDTVPPGQSVAAPSPISGELAGRRYTRGTSNATALATRTAALLLDTIAELQDGPGGDAIVDACVPAILKALLVHGASWHDGHDALTSILRDGLSRTNPREYSARFNGYGDVDVFRVLASTDERVTVVGCGVFEADGGHQFSFPLPTCLSGRRDWRRLTITLAWLAPINPARRAYRKAALSCGPGTKTLNQVLGVRGQDVDGRAVTRGTVQHQVFEGQAVRAFAEDDALEFQVDCRAEAGPLDGQPVRYGLVVTLEVAEGVGLPLYEEIFLRIRQPVRVTTTA